MPLPLAVIGIQCRVTSSRLPCKALLKLSDTTVLGMCIQRAKNTGQPVFLLTSDQEEDDLAVAVAIESRADGIIRGSLDNVLSRYLMLAKAYPCEYIVRVTADNPLTEYEFVNPLISCVKMNNLPYAWIEPSLCPEGTNIEIFSKEALIRSAKTDKSDANLEHVTTYMRHNLSDVQRLKGIACDWFPFDCNNLSFTIDMISDYIKVAKLISSVEKESQISWREPLFVKACAEFAFNHRTGFDLGRNHPIS